MSDTLGVDDWAKRAVVQDAAAVTIPRVYRFKPALDISAYELALCVPLLINHIRANEVDALPPEARRHFQLVERSSPFLGRR